MTLRKFIRTILKGRYTKPNFKTYRALNNKSFVQISLFFQQIIKILKSNELIIFYEETKFNVPKSHKKFWILDGKIKNIAYPERLKAPNLLLAVGPDNFVCKRIESNIK